MLNISRAVGIILCILSVTPVYANNSNVALGAKLGTQGLGIDGRVPLTKNLYGRLGVNYFQYGTKISDSGLDYKVKATLMSAPLILDYHPFDDSGFRLSAGVAYNGNKIEVTVKQNQGVNLYGNDYNANQFNNVHARLALGNKLAGIFAIGYDNSFISEGPVSFNADLGVMYAGCPKFKFSTTSLSQQSIDDLNKEVNKTFKDGKRILHFYPIMSIGLRINL